MQACYSKNSAAVGGNVTSFQRYAGKYQFGGETTSQTKVMKGKSRTATSQKLKMWALKMLAVICIIIINLKVAQDVQIQ